MSADSSEDKKQGTPVPGVVFDWPSKARDRESIADFSYLSPEGWWANGMLGYAKGAGLYIQRITVEAPAGQRVTAKMVRDVPLTEIIARAQRQDFVANAAVAEHMEALEPEAETEKRPGRTPLSDDLLRSVALAYLEETEPDKGRGAVKRLAERMSVDQKTMSRYVYRARQSGWLGPAIQGREGSEPGPRLLDELPSGPLTARMTRTALHLSPEEAAEFMRERSSSEPPEE